MGTKSASKLLRELREARGESLRKAARELGVAPSYLSRIERGEKTPSAELRTRVAKYYEIEPDVLALADGAIPPDIVRILTEHPELIDRIRAEYGRQ
jgi:transcriptional regulator with XRE-family HTH domain